MFIRLKINDTVHLKKHYSLEDHILYFLHIPKTAGTTFTFTLDSYYDIHEIYPERIFSKLIQNPPINFPNLKLIRGHFGHGISKLLSKPPLYLTFLRDPIERTLSFYDHMRLDPYTNNWTNSNFILDEDNISQLLENKNKEKVFTNNQTRHIALDLDIEKLIDIYKFKNNGNFLLEEFDEFLSPQISENELILKAKENLQKFAFVGLTEKTIESYFLFCYTFGLQPLGNLWKLMITPKRTDVNSLDQSTLNKIKKCNKLDLELYTFAKQLFDFRYSQMINDLKELYQINSIDENSLNIKMYDFLDQNYKQQFQMNYNIQNFVDYNFSEKFNGYGWYYREFIPEYGTYYRWTGPSTESTVDFLLQNNVNYIVELDVIKYISIEQLEKFQLNVNNNNVELKIISKNNDKISFLGLIPKSFHKSQDQLMRLKIKIPKVLETNLTNLELSDSRLVGLAFSNIKIYPNPKY